MSDHNELVQHADNAYEAIRALNHGTVQALPAPVVYALLGSLNNLGYGLNQLLGQISGGLDRSLIQYDVYDHNRDPYESVALADQAMREAAQLAAKIGGLLESAQVAINAQGYNLPDDADGNGRGGEVV